VRVVVVVRGGPVVVGAVGAAVVVVMELGADGPAQPPATAAPASANITSGNLCRADVAAPPSATAFRDVALGPGIPAMIAGTSDVRTAPRSQEGLAWH
jgi:hypothetical protein